MTDRTVSILCVLWAILAIILVVDIAHAEPRPIHEGIHEGIHGTFAQAVRGTQTQIIAPPTPPTTMPPSSPPIDGDCASWKPLLAKYGMPYELFRPVMYRESRCANAHNYNRRTRDDSYGPLQVNRYGSLDAGWNSVGISRSYMATPEGAVHAASMLYHSCGSLGPWTRPYSCKKWLF